MDFSKFKKIMRFVGILPKRNIICPKILQQSSYRLMKKISTAKQWSPTLQTPTALLGLLTYFKRIDPVKEEFNSIMKKSSNLIEDKHYEMAEKYLENALALAKQMESAECIANVYDVMGNSALRQNNYVKARQYYNRELKALKSEPYEEGSIKILRARVKIAYVRQRQGKYHVSKSEYKELLGKIQLQLNSADKNNNVALLELLAFAKNQLGNVYLQIRQYEEAKKCFADAYKAYSKAYEKDNIEIVDVLCNMSYACQLCEDKSAAIKFLEAALTTAERLKDEVEVARIKTELGMLYLKGSLMTRAKKNCEDALKVGIEHNNKFVIEQATNCLAQIKEACKKK